MFIDFFSMDLDLVYWMSTYINTVFSTFELNFISQSCKNEIRLFAIILDLDKTCLCICTFWLGQRQHFQMVSILMKSTPRAVPHKRCSPPNLSWLGDFHEILSSLEIFAVWETPFLINFFIFDNLWEWLIANWLLSLVIVL